MEKRSAKVHPAEWALFLVDDGLQYWHEWGEKKSTGEDGCMVWTVGDGRLVIIPENQDFRTELCGLPVYRDPFRMSVEVFRVYRAHVGDTHAWSWSSLPGKRLDEGIISRLVQGRYAEKEMDHLGDEASGMDMRKILLIGAAAVVLLAGFYFVVLPRLSSDKPAVVPVENNTEVIPDGTSDHGHWEETTPGHWDWIVG